MATGNAPIQNGSRVGLEMGFATGKDRANKRKQKGWVDTTPKKGKKGGNFMLGVLLGAGARQGPTSV